MYRSQTKTKDIKLSLYQSSISAGFPSPADDFVERKLDLNEHLIKHPAATFFVRVRGSSMHNSGISDGDLLIVDRSLDPRDKSIVIALVEGEFTLKRVHLIKNKLYLVPENSNYDPIEITEEMDFIIWGVATNVIKNL